MTPDEKTRMLAEWVMGWFSPGCISATFSRTPEFPWDPVSDWSPLTKLSHAGEVLEAMIRKGFEFDAQDCGVGKYQVWFRGNGVRVRVMATTFPTAICHAALLAVGVKEEEP